MTGPGGARRAAVALVRLPAAVAVLLVRAYQLLVSPLLGPTCRYAPSCSTYAVQALRSRGLVVGSGLTAWRLLRCNPWSPGGYDPVPARGGPQDRHPHQHRTHRTRT